MYKIFAAFAGSDSYYSSYAGTTLSVGPAPETSSQQPTTEPEDNTMTTIGVGVILAIIIVIVGVLLYRKK